MFNREKYTLGEVPVYINQSTLPNYIAESYLLLKAHYSHLKTSQARFAQFEEQKRAAFFSSLKQALTRNAQNLEPILALLKQHLTVEALDSVHINPNDDEVQLILKDFSYMRRDWTYLPSGERQLSIINDQLKKELAAIDVEKRTALFLGCGVGRLAMDFIEPYQKVFATDKSFSMIWHIQELIKGRAFTFYNPRTRNIQSIANAAQEYKGQIPAEVLDKVNADSFGCFVSDVLDLPLVNQSQDAVFSIYFSDVVALKLWFGEIDRVLTDNGLFIHFGPLDYFFGDIREMLTAEEFRQFFEAKGYRTLVDRVVEAPHLDDPNSNSLKGYRNWFFIAQKQTVERPSFAINQDSILYIKKPIPYRREGLLQHGEQETDVILGLPQGEFEGAGAVMVILQFVDGKNTFAQIIEQLNVAGYTVDDPTEIRDLLLSFLYQGVLEIIE